MAYGYTTLENDYLNQSDYQIIPLAEMNEFLTELYVREQRLVTPTPTQQLFLITTPVLWDAVQLYHLSSYNTS